MWALEVLNEESEPLGLRVSWFKTKIVICTVCEHQLQLYGHVARFPDADPAHQILTAREPH